MLRVSRQTGTLAGARLAIAHVTARRVVVAISEKGRQTGATILRDQRVTVG
jgi:hypothetical protein